MNWILTVGTHIENTATIEMRLLHIYRLKWSVNNCLSIFCTIQSYMNMRNVFEAQRCFVFWLFVVLNLEKSIWFTEKSGTKETLRTLVDTTFSIEIHHFIKLMHIFRCLIAKENLRTNQFESRSKNCKIVNRYVDKAVWHLNSFRIISSVFPHTHSYIQRESIMRILS